jgi:hypothetical protein
MMQDYLIFSVMALWKRGWVEIPEVMGSSVLGLIGKTLSQGFFVHQ